MKLTYSIPIRAKLVLIILVFALLPMFVLTLVWYNTAVGSVSTLVRNSLDVRAREVSAQITRLSKGNPAEIKGELLERAVGPRTVALTKNSPPLDEQAVLSQREILILDLNETVLYAGHRSWEGQSVQAVVPEDAWQRRSTWLPDFSSKGNGRSVFMGRSVLEDSIFSAPRSCPVVYFRD